MFAFPCRLLKAIQYLICLFFFLFLLKSCEKTTSPFNPTIISLKSEYVGVTEADIQLSIKNLELPVEFRLFRDDSLLRQGHLITTDTLVMDTLLLPAHSYSYKAFIFRGENHIAQSEPLMITTMDTTSHEIQWELYTFESPYGSAALYDVTIIDEDNVWAVGEIYSDSAQPWLPYNAVHWDGQQWELLRVPYIYHGSPVISPIMWIYSFDSQNIWFGNSVYWDGQHFQNVDIAISIFSGIGINKMWGCSNGEMYVVGNQGTIAYSYDVGRTWIQLESGTDLPIQDIWGAVGPKTGKEVILCVASNKYNNHGKRVLKIEDGEVTSMWDDGLPWSLSSVWFISNLRYYVTGNGIFEKKRLTDLFWKNKPGDFTPYYTYRIRGNALNNVWAVGGFGEVLHFNGNNWKSYFNSTHLGRGNYYSLDLFENMVVVVGYNSPNAEIAVGQP